jgi:hypothetical protein
MANEFRSPITIMVRWVTMLLSAWISQIDLHILIQEEINLITLCMLM